VYYDDGDSSQWVDTSPQGSGVSDAISEGNTSAEVIDTGSDGRFVVTTEGTERLRVDPSGKLLVGTSSARAVGQTIAGLQLAGDIDQSAASLACYVNSGFGARVNLSKSRGTSEGSFTVVQSGDELGSVIFCGADGTDLETRAASIEAAVDGTPGANDMPGRLVFSTTSDGASSPTERLRITSAGNVGIGTTSPGELLHVYNSAATSRLIVGPNGTGAALPNALALEQENIGYTVCHVRNLYNNAGLGELRLGGYGFTTFTSGSSQTERARIDSSGRLLVGTSTNIGSQNIQIGTAQGTLGLYKFANNDDGGELTFATSRNGTVGSQTIVNNGDFLGRMFLGQ
jgi:hypothetical protein